ncbi:MAG: phosphate/phosphite/phosphonate ABC transporter substrate-binding protein [Chloroflexi bacterium]|nr:phosphate/phosphite/phosphonate ABC transporter substrate-binding protein [Chloroflexota bacterium]
MRKLLVVLLAVTLVLVFSIHITFAQEGDIGSESNPIQVFFVPSVEAETITTGGQIMADALEAATGLNFEVSVPTSYAATVEAMCASPSNSIGFIPAAGYVIANQRCGVNISLQAVRRGWAVYWSMFIVRRDSDIYTFGDLAGRTWAYSDASSTSGYIFPFAILANAGVVPGDTVETGGHNQTVQAVYSGEVDFGTTFFSPPAMPEGYAAWQIGDLPEPYDLTVDETRTVTEGETTRLFVGDIEILDARRNLASTAPDIVDQVRIIRLSDPIPNDGVTFGPEFPEELRQQIVDAIIAFSATEGWASSIGNRDFYGWSSVVPADDELFADVRALIINSGLTEQDIFGG